MCISRGEQVIAHEEALEGNRHSSILGPFIEKCLQKAGIDRKAIDAVCISAGPGSYTGLRVGTSTAKGLCFALHIPLIAVDTLEAAALHAAEKHTADFIVPMIDARRMEVYGATFDGSGRRITENEALILEKTMFDHRLEGSNRIVLCGNGTLKAKSLFTHHHLICDVTIGHSALHLVKPACSAFLKNEFADLYQFIPAYLKPPNITKPKKSIL